MNDRRPDTERVIAHRGHAKACPENTLAAVRSALEAGARGVEIDVQVSADGEAFLMHDRTLERMCGVAGALGDYPAAEIRKFRASERQSFGDRFANEPVASLAQFAETLARAPRTHAYVELKRASIERFGVDAVLDAVLPALLPIRQRCTLISFDVAVLRAARERTSLPVGPVLITWRQHESDEVVSLRPGVVFCDVDKLPASGPLHIACGELAIYEVADAVLARQLFERGAAFVETFAVADLLAGLERNP